MISHAFPPTGGSGVQRTAKFARYLPEFGWQPIVFSADAVADLPRDESLVRELPADLDHRVRRAVHPVHAARRVVRSLRDGIGTHTVIARCLDRLDRSIQRVGYRAAAWSIPDDALPWAIASLPALRRIIRRERIDAIYSTFSPASNHLLAWLLKRRSGLPWVADFRDLWTDNFDFRESRTRRWLEGRFLESADAVTGVSDDQARILAGHVPGREGKFATIPNGADAADFAGLDRASLRKELQIPHDRFVLSYVGSFVASAEPRPILDGLEAFVQTLTDRARFEFRLVGTVPASILRYVRRSGVQPKMTGYVSHARAVREMVAADCLLLGNATTGMNCESVLPGKLFEYFAAGRPIVHIGPSSGATDAMIRKCQAGVTVPPDAGSISGSLNIMWRRWLQGDPPGGCTPDRLAPYTRRNLTRDLATVLDDVVAAAPGHVSSAGIRASTSRRSRGSSAAATCHTMSQSI